MKRRDINILTGIVVCALLNNGFAQAPCVVYDANDYLGKSYALNIGAGVTLKTGNGISFEVNNPTAALKITRLSPYYGDNGGNAPYTDMFIYTESSQPFMTNEGTNGQFAGVELHAVCQLKKSVPEPEIYIPVEGNNMFNEEGKHEHLVPVAGKRMLMLKRAFFWENSEQLDSPCPEAHGPYAALGVGVFDPKILDYSFSRMNVQNNYSPLLVECNLDTQLYRTDAAYRQFVHANPCDFPCFSGEVCKASLSIPNAGCKLYGPIYHAVTPNCEIDLGWFGSIDFGAPPDAFKEWIDGPWGCVYSNVGLLNWDNFQGDKVVVGVAEGDQYHDYLVLDFGTLDDFMGGGVVTRDMEGEILINVGAYGWLVVKNEIYVTEPTEETTDHYWYPSWDGNYPEAVCGPLKPTAVQETKDDFCVTENQVFRIQSPYMINVVTNDSIPMPDSIVISNPDYSLDTINYLDYIFQQNLSNLTIFGGDTIVFIPAKEYRSLGSQYKPYFTLEQVERFVPIFDSVGVYNGVISTDNHLTKELTYLPLDPEQKFHRDSILTGKRKAQPFPTGQKPVKGMERYATEGNSQQANIEKDAELKIYPTLASETITVEAYFDKATVLDICLVNSFGQVVKVVFSNKQYDRNFMTESIPLHGLEKGVYFLQLFDHGSGLWRTGRFVKTD